MLLDQNQSGEVTVVDFFTENMADRTAADQRAEDLSAAMRDARDPFVTVHRILGGGNTPEEFVARFPADKYDFGQLQQHISDNFGGGDYRVRLYAKGGLVKGGNRLLSIAHKKLQEAPVISGTSDLVQMMQVFMTRLDAQNQQMLQIMRGNQGGNRAEFFDEMIKMKQLFSNDSGGGNGIGMVRDTLGFIKELGIPVGVSQEKEVGFGDLLEKLAPLVVAANQSPQPQNRPPEQHQAPNQAPNQAPKSQKMTEEQAMSLRLRMGVSQLVAAAKKSADPGVWATTVLDMIGEESAKAFILSENAMENLIAINADVEHLKEWFGLLAEHIKAQLGLESSVSAEYDDSTIPFDVVPPNDEKPSTNL
jgi:hypothetical protein